MHYYKGFRILSRLLPFLFLGLLLFAFDEAAVAGATITAALIHEAGHLLAYLLLGHGRVKFFSVFSGPRFRFPELLSYREEIAVLLAGPLANLAFALLCLLLSGRKNGYFAMLSVLNLLSALSNLLPAEGYDGYRVLALAAEAKGRSERWLKALSLAFSAGMIFFSLWLIGRIGTGYWIFFVFAGIFLSGTARSDLSAKSEEKRVFRRISENFGVFRKKVSEISRRIRSNRENS